MDFDAGSGLEVSEPEKLGFAGAKSSSEYGQTDHGSELRIAMPGNQADVQASGQDFIWVQRGTDRAQANENPALFTEGPVGSETPTPGVSRTGRR